jgi:site-specific recombinase XerC
MESHDTAAVAGDGDELSAPAEAAPADEIEDREGAEAAFDAWVESIKPENGFKPRTVSGYKQIWTPWLRFLAGRRKRWDEASPDDVGVFLDNLGHSSKKRTAASHVTVRRYWSVIEKIYGHAVRDAKLKANPVSSATRPSKSEDTRSVGIFPKFLDQLRAHLPVGVDVITLRDRALLAVLLEVGPTTRELIDLRPNGVQRSTVHPGYELHLTGSRKPQNRKLDLGRTASDALHEWMAVRETLARRADRVFVSMRRNQPLKPADVLEIASTWLNETAPKIGLPVVDHMGANSLRTAVLIRWRDVDKLPTDELLRRAGLAETQALRRLPLAASEAENPDAPTSPASNRVAAPTQ